MEASRVAFGEAVPLAFDRLDVQDHRTIEVGRFVEELDQGRDVVSVDGTDRDEIELLEPGVLGNHRLAHLTHPVIELGQRPPAGNVSGDLLGGLLEASVGMAQPHPIEVGGHGALGLRDRHAVVVEDHQELTPQGAGVVEPLHRQAVDDRGVADQGDRATAIRVVRRPPLTIERVASGHAHRRGDAGAGVADGEEVVVAFTGFRETGHALASSKTIQHRQPAGQQLVGVALVTDVEQQTIVPEVEDVVHRDRKLDHTEIRREVSAALSDLVADGEPDLRRELGQLVDRQGLEVAW